MMKESQQERVVPQAHDRDGPNEPQVRPLICEEAGQGVDFNKTSRASQVKPVFNDEDTPPPFSISILEFPYDGTLLPKQDHDDAAGRALMRSFHSSDEAKGLPHEIGGLNQNVRQAYSSHLQETDNVSEISNEFEYNDFFVEPPAPASCIIIVDTNVDNDRSMGIFADNDQVTNLGQAKSAEGDCFIVRRRLCLIRFLAGLILFIGLLGLILALTLRRDISHSVAKTEPSFSLPPTIERFALNLPSYTREALRNELPATRQDANWAQNELWTVGNGLVPSSSQGMAWKWLLSDPNLSTRSLEDITLRFALSTLFYATDGPNWKNATNWLSYTEDVCFWWREYRASLIRNGPYNSYEEYCQARGFVELTLISNGLSGSIPPELSLLSNLQLVKLAANSLHSTIPDVVWKSWRRLRTLSLAGNILSGSLPPTLGRLSDLEIFEIDYNRFSGSLSPEMGSMTSLWIFSASSNTFTGRIPSEIGRLAGLHTFDFSSNKLTGEIPSQISKLKELEILDLGMNRLSGSLPSVLGWCKKLSVFRAAYNDLLSGSIPSAFNRLSEMRDLYLNNNSFTGSLPIEMGRLTGLFELDVSASRMSGTVPTELARLSRLTSLRVFDTYMSGEIPSTVCSGFSLQEANTGIVIDCDQVTCACNCSCA